MCGNVGAVLASGIKLKQFTVAVQSSSKTGDVFVHLHELQVRGFFQELVLQFDSIERDDNNIMVGMSSLTSLVGLVINDAQTASSIQLAQNLKRLKFLVFNFASATDIIPFMIHCIQRNPGKLNSAPA